MSVQNSRIYINGIDAATGDYLIEPVTPEQAVALARGEPLDRGAKSWLERIWEAMRQPFMGLPLGVDATDVAQAGWAVVFASDTPDEIRRAIEPLIEHRKTQVPTQFCKVLEYNRGEGLNDWLRRHGVYPGSVAPTKVPYYVMLVGDPSSIPFQFQYLLDIEYAVGRLSFDLPEQYQQYVQSVLAYETSEQVPTSREVVYWGVRHANDPATTMSADHLIAPLYEGVAADGGQAAEEPVAKAFSFNSRCFLAEDATRANLAELLHLPSHSRPPAMLFTASHGMGFGPGHERQVSEQGALVCQDWPGTGSVEPHHFLGASGIGENAHLHGLVAFLFACYGAGTPAHDTFLTERGRGPVPIAEQSFVAALPQRLLSHPAGGALAVLGHVERAWGYSIRPPGVGAQIQPFRNLIGRILSGEPVGHATKDLSDKYAALSSELLSKLDETQPDRRPSDMELAWLWIERNDAQNYIVLGDPAVRSRACELD